uniref:Amino acid permease/ SLC12A domain-containing protein n=1 Tax=Romanomermis culicivorax TaxID=13658 RepID=A0A915HUZ3_ROMCU
MISVAWEAKVELGLLALVTLSYVSYIIGTMISPGDAKRARGVTGYKWSTFKENFHASWTDGETFVTVFAIYFPSITGIMAGAGISGELKEPDKSLPKGTLLGILITSLVYMSGIVLTGATCLRHASGNIEQIHNLTLLTACRHNNTCTEGLLHNYNVRMIFSLNPCNSKIRIFILGHNRHWYFCNEYKFGLDFDSNIAENITGQKSFLVASSYSHGKDGEPRLAYCVVLLIAMLIISIDQLFMSQYFTLGDLNLIAPLISNFYLASFALINYACFDGSLSKSPGWRPAFKYYNMWVALFGAGLCIFAMFLMQWATALVTIAIMFFLYVYVLRSKPMSILKNFQP